MFGRCAAANSAEDIHTAGHTPVGATTPRMRPRNSASSKNPVTAYPITNTASRPASGSRTPPISGTSATAAGSTSSTGRRTRTRNPAVRQPLVVASTAVTAAARVRRTTSRAVQTDACGHSAATASAPATVTTMLAVPSATAARRGRDEVNRFTAKLLGRSVAAVGTMGGAQREGGFRCGARSDQRGCRSPGGSSDQHAGAGDAGEDHAQTQEHEGGGPGVRSGDLVGHGEPADRGGEPVVGAVGEDDAAADDHRPENGVGRAGAHDESAGGVPVDADQRGGDQAQGRAGGDAGQLETQVVTGGGDVAQEDSGGDGDEQERQGEPGEGDGPGAEVGPQDEGEQAGVEQVVGGAHRMPPRRCRSGRHGRYERGGARPSASGWIPLLRRSPPTGGDVRRRS